MLRNPKSSKVKWNQVGEQPSIRSMPSSLLPTSYLSPQTSPPTPAPHHPSLTRSILKVLPLKCAGPFCKEGPLLWDPDRSHAAFPNFSAIRSCRLCFQNIGLKLSMCLDICFRSPAAIGPLHRTLVHNRHVTERRNACSENQVSSNFSWGLHLKVFSGCIPGFVAVHLLNCVPMDCSTTGLPVLNETVNYLPDFAQTNVQSIGDAIQPYHPLSPPSPPALNPSQH